MLRWLKVFFRCGQRFTKNGHGERPGSHDASQQATTMWQLVWRDRFGNHGVVGKVKGVSIYIGSGEKCQIRSGSLPDSAVEIWATVGGKIFAKSLEGDLFINYHKPHRTQLGHDDIIYCCGVSIRIVCSTQAASNADSFTLPPPPDDCWAKIRRIEAKDDAKRRRIEAERAKQLRLRTPIRVCPDTLASRCPQQWGSLQRTSTESVRYCPSCDANVYFCNTQEELNTHASMNRCVAFLGQSTIPDQNLGIFESFPYVGQPPPVPPDLRCPSCGNDSLSSGGDGLGNVSLYLCSNCDIRLGEHGGRYVLARKVPLIWIEEDGGKTTRVPLIRSKISLGRVKGNTIRLTSPSVADYHACLLVDKGRVAVEVTDDQHSVTVNGWLVRGRIVLQQGDCVQIGDYTFNLRGCGWYVGDSDAS